jgi:hypothetical protein
VVALVRDAGGTLPGGVNLIEAKLGGNRSHLGAAVNELVNEGVLMRGGARNRPTLTLGGTTKDSE